MYTYFIQSLVKTISNESYSNIAPKHSTNKYCTNYLSVYNAKRFVFLPSMEGKFARNVKCQQDYMLMWVC